MKRFLTVLFCLLLAACLAACTPNGNDETTGGQEGNTLQVGFGREDITPDYSVLLGGYSGRWNSQVLDHVYATCLAFTDDDNNTILAFHMDLISFGGTVLPFARKAVSEAVGLPIDNIMVCCTHTHSAPSVSSTEGVMEDYAEFLEEKMIAAAKAALEDRKPSQMFATKTTLTGLNFVRHYYMNDGSVVGDNFGDPEGKTYVKHVKDADNEMQLVRFEREGGKDVVLVNWQVHPIRTAHTRNTFDLSSDVVGSMRSVLESQMDCYMAYFTGGSGNLDPTSRITSENITSDYIEQGTMMAQKAILACDNMTQMNTGKVQILRKDMEQSALQIKKDIRMYAFSIGDVAFITAPYEMFDTNGKFIKDNSPFDITFIATCANGYNGYIAAEWAYAYDSYEVGTANWNKGTAESLADGYVDMLKELYPTRGANADSKPSDNPANVSLGYNLDMGKVLSSGTTGNYTVNFLVSGEKKTYKVTDEAIAQALETLDFVGLILDADTITGLVRIHDLPYARLAWNRYIVSIGGTTVKLSTPDAFVDAEITLKLPKDMPVYDAMAKSSTQGATTPLQKNDCVSIIADADGTALYAYVTSRPAVPHEGTLYCQHCKKDVSNWYDWTSDSGMPTTEGHYIITNDMTLSATSRVSRGKICLDLNGKTVTQSTKGQRVYNIGNTATLSIMDNVGGGKIIPASADNNQTEKFGMGINIEGEATLNFYSGTIDARDCVALYGLGVNSTTSATFNMYGGEILGGTAYGAGSTAISANGFFNMYDGRIVGGKCETTSYVNPVGGATIRVLGTTTIYGGIIEGGESAVDGGVIRVCGDIYACKLIMKGGTVIGGTAPKGGGIYVVHASVTISGDVKITGSENGNLFLGTGATLTIGEEGLGEEAQIGITVAGMEEFLTNAPAGLDLSKYFISDDASKKVVKTGDGSWSIK